MAAFIQRGYRTKISDFFNPDTDINVSVTAKGNAEYDSCCFGVDKADMLSDDTLRKIRRKSSAVGITGETD